MTERVRLTTPRAVRTQQTSRFVLMAAFALCFFFLGMGFALAFVLHDVPDSRARPAYWIHR